MNFFSEHLNSLIRNHKDNLSKIAQNIGISRPSLYDLINGKNLPRDSTLEQICSALSMSENESKRLRDLNHSEKLRSSRKEQKKYLMMKKNLTSEVSSLLLGKGHEISRPKGPGEADLVLRQNRKRVPMLICPSLTDHSSILGRLLTSMFYLSSDKGYIISSDTKQFDRKITQLFHSHGIMALSIKGMIREFKSFL